MRHLPYAAQSLSYLLWLPIAVVMGSGCVSQDRYVIPHDELQRMKQANQPGEVVSAVRLSDHKPVKVKVAALEEQTLAPHGDGTFSIRAKGHNPAITAGSVLTWTGTAISLIGTALLAVGKVKDNQALFYIGGISALSAEPLMWTGTGLWIYGAMRPPYEVPVSAPSP
jgi:hypothetical protein